MLWLNFFFRFEICLSQRSDESFHKFLISLLSVVYLSQNKGTFSSEDTKLMNNFAEVLTFAQGF